MAEVMTGHCSKCGKIWTLETGQGVCQWCGQSAICQTTRTQPRHIKSSRKRKQRQAGDGNGYDQLEGEYLTYYKVASRFSYKAKVEDREDLLHDIMIVFADVASSDDATYRASDVSGSQRYCSPLLESTIQAH